MSFRISYHPQCDHKDEKSIFFRLMLTASFFICFVWSVNQFWPEGKELLKLLLIPGDPDTTLEAAEAFAKELGAGEQVSAAWHRFASAVTGTYAAA